MGNRPKVDKQKFIEDIRAGLSLEDVRTKHDMTPTAFQNLLIQLLEQGRLTEHDLRSLTGTTSTSAHSEALSHPPQTGVRESKESHNRGQASPPQGTAEPSQDDQGHNEADPVVFLASFFSAWMAARLITTGWITFLVWFFIFLIVAVGVFQGSKKQINIRAGRRRAVVASVVLIFLNLLAGSEQSATPPQKAPQSNPTQVQPGQRVEPARPATPVGEQDVPVDWDSQAKSILGTISEGVNTNLHSSVQYVKIVQHVLDSAKLDDTAGRNLFAARCNEEMYKWKLRVESPVTEVYTYLTNKWRQLPIVPEYRDVYGKIREAYLVFKKSYELTLRYPEMTSDIEASYKRIQDYGEEVKQIEKEANSLIREINQMIR